MMMDLSNFKYVVAMAVAKIGYRLGDDGVFYPVGGYTDDDNEAIKGPLEFNFDYVDLPYTIAGTYTDNNGKFNKVLGNVAIVDCNYFFDDLLDGY